MPNVDSPYSLDCLDEKTRLMLSKKLNGRKKNAAAAAVILAYTIVTNTSVSRLSAYKAPARSDSFLQLA